MGCDLYLAACTGDVKIGGAGEPLPRGYEAVARILEEDIATGVNFSVDEVIASPDITILEGSFINPPIRPLPLPTQDHSGLPARRRGDPLDPHALRITTAVSRPQPHAGHPHHASMFRAG